MIEKNSNKIQDKRYFLSVFERKITMEYFSMIFYLLLVCFVTSLFIHRRSNQEKFEQNMKRFENKRRKRVRNGIWCYCNLLLPTNHIRDILSQSAKKPRFFQLQHKWIFRNLKIDRNDKICLVVDDITDYENGFIHLLPLE